MVDIPRNRKNVREPGLIPMINIVLLLLVFFLVAGSIEKFDVLPIEVPVAKNGKMLADGQIMILLGSQKEIIVNDEFVASSAFMQTIKDHLQENHNKIISLKADEHLPATYMISIMNQIKEAGGTNISLITTPF